jgi:hypothetical protein
MQFYGSDWLKDTRCLTLEEKGAWIDLIVYMWECKPRGQFERTFEEIGLMLGVDQDRAKGIIEKLHSKKILDMRLSSFVDSVTNGNSRVTVMSRRIMREENERESTRIRVERFRSNGNKKKSNAPVTRIFQKSEVILKNKDIKEPQPTVAKIAVPENPKEMNPIQKVIYAYRESIGIPEDQKKEWNKLFFSRYSRSAKSLLDFMGDVKSTADCIQETVEKIKAWNPEASISLDTILNKHAAEWKKNKSEKEAKFGN